MGAGARSDQRHAARSPTQLNGIRRLYMKRYNAADEDGCSDYVSFHLPFLPDMEVVHLNAPA